MILCIDFILSSLEMSHYSPERAQNMAGKTSRLPHYDSDLEKCLEMNKMDGCIF